jgi:hypothetical protein
MKQALKNRLKQLEAIASKPVIIVSCDFDLDEHGTKKAPQKPTVKPTEQQIKDLRSV